MRAVIASLLRLSIVACLPLAAAGQATNAVASVLSDSNAAHNFKVALTFPKTTFTNGEPVICEAGLTNISDTPTIVIPSYLQVNLTFLVTNANGDQVPPLHLVNGGSYSGPELVPAHSAEFRFIPFPLNEYFGLTPGSYRACVVRDLDIPSITFTSQVVTIKILESSVPASTSAPPVLKSVKP
jgi:hypothetical protein